MITRIAVYIRRLRRRFSRSYWALRLLGLSKSKEPENSTGLVFIQIDGLSQLQFHHALKRGNLPFLKRLIEHEHYKEIAHYSGLPSATPAVQGELFYGVKGCVPAFQFVDSKTCNVFTMYDAKCASEIESRLKDGNTALLQGGSSYSNIFSGGAEEAHFCSTTLKWSAFFKAMNPFLWPIILIFHVDIFIKTFVLLIVEFFLALFDGIKGALQGEKVLMELQFVLTRVLMCVLLRELIVIGAKIDIARGLPVIHLNFCGYDEQSHRRGPSSDFAHWCLRGIDDSIKRIWREARRAERRDYDIWVYSDHGQEFTKPYPIRFKKRIESVIAEIFGEVEVLSNSNRNMTCCQGRSNQVFQKKVLPHASVIEKTPAVRVTGMGPLVHIYPTLALDQSAKENIIQKLLVEAKVPVVFTAETPGKVRCETLEENLVLPKDAEKIFGKNHPFLESVTEDFIQLCHSPHSGALIIAGWKFGKEATTFPVENGSHASFGPNETNGFALLPSDAPIYLKNKKYLRPIDLRTAALRFLGRSPKEKDTREKYSVTKSFRVMTYNVHGCVGMDGKLSPSRIARVIAKHEPDIVALQELDVERHRSGRVNQAETIADILQMNYHFHPSFHLETGKYGNAVLSRYPIRIVKTGVLPKLSQRKEFEPRGALWVEVDVDGLKINLLNSHLSLWPAERLIQAEALLSDQWAGNEACKEPMILCGDFNARPKSLVCKRIACKLRDAQASLESHEPIGTWLTRFPMYRIDHIFISPALNVLQVSVPRSDIERISSDHAPLIVELQVKP